MNFGYIPDKRRKINVLKKMFGWTKLVRRMQVPVLIKMLDLHNEDILLDLGCGGGKFVYEMSKRCESVGIDISPTIKNRGFAQKQQPNVAFMVADGLNLPFKNNSFDKVLLGGTLQSGKQDGGITERNNIYLLKECRRILKEDSIVVLSVVQERRAIRIMYENNRFCTKKLVKLFNLPRNYAEFEKNYMEWTKIPKFYTIEGLTVLMEKNGFKVIEIEFAPKEIGSKVLDILLLLSCCLKIPRPNSPIYFPILYPLIYFLDKLSKDKLKGNEFIMKAEVKNHAGTSD